MTYLERYTLLAINGLAAHEQEDDGESAGARRRVARPPKREAPKAEPVGPPVDPETGELQSPSLIPVKQTRDGKGSDWMGWGSVLAAALKFATSAADLEAWITANEQPLGNCERDAPKIAERLSSIIETRRDTLLQAEARDAVDAALAEPESADAEAGEAA